jgi:hypothetical protein
MKTLKACHSERSEESHFHPDNSSIPINHSEIYMVKYETTP